MGSSPPSPPDPPKSGSPPYGPSLRRRRTRSTSSSASSLSTSSSTPSPSPSHINNFFQYSPFRSFSSSSSIPFSWERLPGIPKNPTTKSPKRPPDPLLPLPPPLRSHSLTPRKKRSDPRSAADDDPFAGDPFAAALAECAKEPPPPRGDLEELFFRKGSAAAAAIGRRRAIVASISDRFGLFDLYGSCKASCSVSESTISVPRPGHRTGSYGILNRRPG